MKTFRDYINENSFEEVWKAIVEIFEEPEEIRPVYEEYYDLLRNLPINPQKDKIKFVNPYGRNECYHLGEQPLGMNGAPEYLIDKNVYLGEADLDSHKITAILIYWASFHSYLTSKENDDDLLEYLAIITGEDEKSSQSDYVCRRESTVGIIEKSLEKKRAQFWNDRTEIVSPGDWRGILLILKAAIEFNIGFMRGYADHAGREPDADRMQLCCNLINIATKRIYPEAREKKALRILFGILERNIYKWDD